MSGMITKPPPKLSAPTLNAVQASEPSPAAGGAAAPPGAQAGELGGRRPGQQVAGGDRVLGLAGGDPPAPLHAQLAQEQDVGRRPTEPDRSQPPPLPGDGPERLSRGRRHAASSAWRATGAPRPWRRPPGR